MTRPRKISFGYATNKKYDGMMGRCYREADRSYKNYGGRGIRVCLAWITDIESFRNWVRAELLRLGITEEEFATNSKSLQLDRTDVNGHYTPENCRLVSPQKNGRNKRKSTRRLYETAEGITVVV